MVAVQVESPAIERAKMARAAMEECNNNRVQAIALYRRWLDDDPELASRLLPSFVDDGLAADIAGVDTGTRKQLRMVAIRANQDQETPKRKAAPDKSAPFLLELLQRQQDDPDFHAWPLPGGKLLGEATPADVLLAARFYGESAHTHRVNQRWFELIYEAMQGGTCVGNVLSHAALLRLRRRAEDGE